MGKKSQLKMLGKELKLRVKMAKKRVVDDFKRGQIYGTGLKYFQKLKPMEKHIDAGNCPLCNHNFAILKNDPDILALPENSLEEASIIIWQKPHLRQALKDIIDCPMYKEERKGR